MGGLISGLCTIALLWCVIGLGWLRHESLPAPNVINGCVLPASDDARWTPLMAGYQIHDLGIRVRFDSVWINDVLVARDDVARRYFDAIDNDAGQALRLAACADVERKLLG